MNYCFTYTLGSIFADLLKPEDNSKYFANLGCYVFLKKQQICAWPLTFFFIIGEFWFWWCAPQLFDYALTWGCMYCILGILIRYYDKWLWIWVWHMHVSRWQLVTWQTELITQWWQCNEGCLINDFEHCTAGDYRYYGQKWAYLDWHAQRACIQCIDTHNRHVTDWQGTHLYMCQLVIGHWQTSDLSCGTWLQWSTDMPS